MKTLRVSILPLLIASGFFLNGCGTTEVAKAQQVTHAASVDFHAFVVFEKANRDQLWKINPSIKHTADKLRHKNCPECDENGVKWLNTAIAMVDSYKDNRTPENRANMDTAIAVIQELVNQITDYFLNAEVRAIDPATAFKYTPTKIVP